MTESHYRQQWVLCKWARPNASFICSAYPAGISGSTCFAASINVFSTLVTLFGFSKPGWTEELCLTSTNSKKHFNYNTNERWYFEGRIGYRVSRYLEPSVSVAYQERNYIYFAMFQQPYREVPLFMKRNYVLLAANLRLYLSDFFHETMKLGK